MSLVVHVNVVVQRRSKALTGALIHASSNTSSNACVNCGQRMEDKRNE